MLPSIEQIENSFGSTHPAVYDAAKNSFALNFRGLTFYFHVDMKMQANFASHGLGSLHFGAGNSPVVTKMALYSGNKFQVINLSCQQIDQPEQIERISFYLKRTFF